MSRRGGRSDCNNYGSQKQKQYVNLDFTVDDTSLAIHIVEWSLEEKRPLEARMFFLSLAMLRISVYLTRAFPLLLLLTRRPRLRLC